MTNEEAIEELKRDIHNAKVTHHLSEHYEIAIKALEQERSRSVEITQYRYDCEKLMEENERLKKALEQEPCEDCISRQATVERLCKVAEFMNEKRNGLGSPYVMAALFIQDNKDEFPPVTPKPKTGHWIAQDIHNCHTDFKCSECGYIHSFMHLYGKPTADYTYCPNCGAKMVKAESEE